MFRSIYTAFRTLRKHRWQSLVNLFGLTLGICACLSIGLIVRYETSFNRSYDHEELIYQVGSLERFSPDDPVQYHPAVWPAFPAALNSVRTGISTVAAFHEVSEVHLSCPASPNPSQHYLGDLQVADSAYFSILKASWLAGSSLSSLNDPGAVVIGLRRARIYFGQLSPEQLIGKNMLINDTLPVHITGVVEDQSAPSDFSQSFVLSSVSLKNPYLRDLLAFDQYKGIPSSSRLLIKKSPFANASLVAQGLQRVFDQRFKTANITGIRLIPLREVHFTSPRTGSLTGNVRVLYWLSGIAGFILFLAVINYVNLATAQALSRTKELAVRKTLGASYRTIAGQLLMETFLISLIATGIGLVIVGPVLRTFARFVPGSVRVNLTDPWTWILVVGVLVATTFLSGVYPAMAMARQRLTNLLNEQHLVPGPRGWGWRRSLIVFQFTIAILFITTTLGMRKQLQFMQTSNPGFESSGVLLLETDDRQHMDNVRLLQEKISRIPGVSAVAKENMPPMGPDRGLYDLEYHGTNQKKLSVAGIKADDQFLPVYQIPLLAGRNLLSSDTLREAIINESLVQALGLKGPRQAIGKQILVWEKWISIVGVVKDFHQDNFREAIRPQVLLDLPSSDLAVKLSVGTTGTAATQKIIEQIEKVWKTVYPDKAFNYTFLDDTLDHFYEDDQAVATLVEASAGVTVLISCIGIFGLTLYSAERRKKEFGIRQILGAGVGEILRLMGKEFLELVFVAMLIGGPLAWYFLQRWLNNFAFRTSGFALIIGEGAAIAYSLVLITVGMQLIKVLKTRPVLLLKRND